MSTLPIPAFVDVTPQPGRRVRDPSGAILPETHILRGVERSSYWLRAERDGDVRLTPHVPEPAAAAEAPAAEPAPVELPALPPADRKPKG